ncbi:RNA polymerase, sigma subunit, ECF family [Actinokineospora alba]|uniref:RNA polymerase, sigma subunit, ECF family n=1 Tax=Actinokineospora alba TaxID=504798 RepID=A0A1H0PPW6_9PSEU|nr:sigma-70 family RNA polymerase sigma factor [Actinokineospora alba]TDP65892.1 RNA polymerase sigma-70 factor (ECF subfamily) [Actinokineospora alba]SDI62775.1 RNA polymerase sigma-70 factor, ECF subfamily [Actinokineospora alba]SDP07044.1 RNA polymerase, sigma subunit, ECF family [Actinokineospora alba]
MDKNDQLARRFEADRDHLRTVAFRILGSIAEADDAVQESWFRLTRADVDEVDNLTGWLTTVVARVCLDMLRTRKSRREELGEDLPEPVAGDDPAREALLADSVGPALLVVLETLAPAERLAFVLHDLFAVPFDEIAEIVGRTPAATRQLASRARRRVRGADPVTDADLPRRRQIVDAFLAASRGGDFDALLTVLDPDVVLRTDKAALVAAAASPGAPELASEVRGGAAVASSFLGRAQAALPALVDGAPAAVWAPDGTPRVVFGFTIAEGKIVGIEIIADQERISSFDVVVG